MKNSDESNEISPEYRRRLEKLYSFILENLSEDISSDDAAKAAGFSTFHFHRIFKSLTNETLWNAIKRIRLETAAKLIIAGSSKMSMSTISMECGFSSPAAFSRAFTAYFGISPSKWKKSRICKDSNSTFAYISPDKLPSYSVDVEAIDSIKIAYTSTLKGYGESEVQKAFWELYQWAETHKIVTPKTQFIGIGLDDPAITPDSKCRYLNAIEVNKQLYERDNSVSFMTIPGGKYAVLQFRGTRNDIPAAYAYLCGVWLPRSNYFPSNSFSFEWYREAPKEDGTLRFDIYLPVH